MIVEPKVYNVVLYEKELRTLVNALKLINDLFFTLSSSAYEYDDFVSYCTHIPRLDPKSLGDVKSAYGLVLTKLENLLHE